jgi:hypothetical protein
MKRITLHLALIGIGTVLVVLIGGLLPPLQTLAYAPEVTPTPTAIPNPPPLDWPLPPPTGDQIAQARQCDLKELPTKRYPATVAMADLATSYKPASACDWAVLAVAYATRLKEEDMPPVEAKQAFLRAVSMNPALALALPMLIGYFDKVSVVKALPFAQQAITAVKIRHSFGGLGTGGTGRLDFTSLDYALTITQADTAQPAVTGESKVDGEVSPIPGTVDTHLVQALGAALTDFVPIQAKLSIFACTDDFPDWLVTITFKDGSTLDLETNGSNLLFSGGPWQTVIEKQRYMQYSSAFLVAAQNIGKALNMPKDQTAGMYCSGLEDTLELAFPSKQPE